MSDQKIAFLGAGSAGVGVANLIAHGMWIESKAAGENRTLEQIKKETKIEEDSIVGWEPFIDLR